MISTLPEMRIERQSLAYEVAKRLSQLIEDGRLAPGTRLIEIDLAKQMGVSRGPLREALRILETMALVETVPGKGSYVAALSRADAEDVYSLRILLEEEAARLAATRAGDEDIEALKEIYTSLIKADEDQDYTLLAGEDILFHQKIWELAGNRLMKQVLDSLVNQTRRYRSLQTHLYQSHLAGLPEHEEIVDAIEKRNPIKAAAAMRKHMTIAAEVGIQNLPENLGKYPE